MPKPACFYTGAVLLADNHCVTQCCVQACRAAAGIHAFFTAAEMRIAVASADILMVTVSQDASNRGLVGDDLLHHCPCALLAIHALLRGEHISAADAGTVLRGPVVRPQETCTCRDGVRIVNVARGGLVDRDAIERGLASGRVGAVGLDVHWLEPVPPDDPLVSHPRVLLTPHIAGTPHTVLPAFCATVVAVWFFSGLSAVVYDPAPRV